MLLGSKEATRDIYIFAFHVNSVYSELRRYILSLTFSITICLRLWETSYRVYHPRMARAWSIWHRHSCLYKCVVRLIWQQLSRQRVTAAVVFWSRGGLWHQDGISHEVTVVIKSIKNGVKWDAVMACWPDHIITCISAQSLSTKHLPVINYISISPRSIWST